MIKSKKSGKNNIKPEVIILFFLFLFITLLIVVGIAIHTSRIGIDIENLIIDTEQPKEKSTKFRAENNAHKYKDFLHTADNSKKAAKPK